MLNEPTKSETAIKAILDLEDENRLLMDENDQLKFENSQLKHHKTMLEDAMKAHINKLKKDVKELEWRGQDGNILLAVSGVLITAFYWMVSYG